MTSNRAERYNALQAVLRSDAASNFAMNPMPASRCSAVTGYRGRLAGIIR